MNKDILIQIMEHIDAACEDLDNWLTCMKNDPYFAPPSAFMENTWSRLSTAWDLFPFLYPDEEIESLVESYSKVRSTDENPSTSSS